MERENQSAQRTTFTPQESDRLDAFARMTDLIHRVPRQLQALEPRWRLMYPDGTRRNRGIAFEVIHQHVRILARTAWNLYQTGCAHDTLLKLTANKIIQKTKALYEAQDQPHQPSDLWHNP
jgi:hypothetical protein